MNQHPRMHQHGWIVHRHVSLHHHPCPSIHFFPLGSCSPANLPRAEGSKIRVHPPGRHENGKIGWCIHRCRVTPAAPVQHQFEAHCDSVVDKPQLSYQGSTFVTDSLDILPPLPKVNYGSGWVNVICK